MNQLTKTDSAARSTDTSRRSFLKVAGVGALTVSVPAWVWSCSKSESQASGKTAQRNAAWEKRATDLEQPSIFTTGAPGKWDGKAGGHVPQVTFSERSVELFTKHSMSEEHYITTHYLRNQDGLVIGLHEFKGTDPEARHTFELPEGTTRITAFSHCNLHDDWKTDPTSVG